MSALDAVLARQSWSKVTEEAPTREELLPLIAASGRVADHSNLRPWRLIELRGDDRVRLGKAIAKAEKDKHPSTKPLRASLLIAVVARHRKSDKVPDWEQDATAAPRYSRGHRARHVGITDRARGTCSRGSQAGGR